MRRRQRRLCSWWQTRVAVPRVPRSAGTVYFAVAHRRADRRQCRRLPCQTLDLTRVVGGAGLGARPNLAAAHGATSQARHGAGDRSAQDLVSSSTFSGCSRRHADGGTVGGSAVGLPVDCSLCSFATDPQPVGGSAAERVPAARTRSEVVSLLATLGAASEGRRGLPVDDGHMPRPLHPLTDGSTTSPGRYTSTGPG